jgi:hypothetical protein
MTVDVFAMPTVFAVLAIRRRKMKRVGGNLCRLCYRNHDDDSRSDLLVATKRC